MSFPTNFPTVRFSDTWSLPDVRTQRGMPVLPWSTKMLRIVGRPQTMYQNTVIMLLSKVKTAYIVRKIVVDDLTGDWFLDVDMLRQEGEGTLWTVQISRGAEACASLSFHFGWPSVEDETYFKDVQRLRAMLAPPPLIHHTPTPTPSTATAHDGGNLLVGCCNRMSARPGTVGS